MSQTTTVEDQAMTEPKPGKLRRFFSPKLAKLHGILVGLGVLKEKVVVEGEGPGVGKDFITRVLPHRGPALLLDRVVVTPEKVTGFFRVTRAVCEGHAIGEVAVFRGVYLAEMANQLAGVWFAIQHPELIGSSRVLFARSGSYKASRFIQVGDLIEMEVACADLSSEIKTTRHGTHTEVIGTNFLVKVGGELKGSVSSIELKGLEPPKTIEST